MEAGEDQGYQGEREQSADVSVMNSHKDNLSHVSTSISQLQGF